MIEKIQANRCTCWCGHTWISEEVPKRCAGKGKHRDWNSRDPRPSPKPTEPEIDPFDEPEVRAPEKKSGSKIAEELLAKMASKLGRPLHAPNCTCYSCKPPKERP